MSAETALNAALLAAGPVTSIVGASVYPDVVPEEILLPSIAYSRVGTEYVSTIHASAPAASKVTLDVWCMATSRTIAEDLADKALTAIQSAEFVPVGRRPEYDLETQTYATVLTVDFWS